MDYLFLAAWMQANKMDEQQASMQHPGLGNVLWW
jgi:hypothetical protein